MARKITCDHCGADVIVDGQQVVSYHEYDVLPFPVAGASLGKRVVVCASCDEKLRRQNGLPARTSRERIV